MGPTLGASIFSWVHFSFSYFLLGSFFFFLGAFAWDCTGDCTGGVVEGGGSRSAVRFNHFLAGGGFSDVEGSVVACLHSSWFKQ